MRLILTIKVKNPFLQTDPTDPPTKIETRLSVDQSMRPQSPRATKSYPKLSSHSVLLRVAQNYPSRPELRVGAKEQSSIGPTNGQTDGQTDELTLLQSSEEASHNGISKANFGRLSKNVVCRSLFTRMLAPATLGDDPTIFLPTGPTDQKVACTEIYFHVSFC